jgi:membrane glycosyltransferase
VGLSESSSGTVAADTGSPAFVRRLLFAALVAATTLGVLALAALALSPGGWGLVDLVLLVLYAVALPWLVIGFSISTIGFCVMRFARDPLATIFPAAARIRGTEPITARPPTRPPRRRSSRRLRPSGTIASR